MKLSAPQVFQLIQLSTHLGVFIICFFLFRIPVQILTVGIMSKLPNGKSHHLSGTDMKALYEYLKLAFPEREHKGW
ncbi:MAG: hypothetical protein RL329_146 [Bacteroidota bacterium]|jgi:hypothetical protein